MEVRISAETAQRIIAAERDRDQLQARLAAAERERDALAKRIKDEHVGDVMWWERCAKGYAKQADSEKLRADAALERERISSEACDATVRHWQTRTAEAEQRAEAADRALEESSRHTPFWDRMNEIGKSLVNCHDELLDGIKRDRDHARAEFEALRAAVGELVAWLPGCDAADCDNPATVGHTFGKREFRCDAHSEGLPLFADLDHAPALRRLLATGSEPAGGG